MEKKGFVFVSTVSFQDAELSNTFWLTAVYVCQHQAYSLWCWGPTTRDCQPQQNEYSASQFSFSMVASVAKCLRLHAFHPSSLDNEEIWNLVCFSNCPPHLIRSTHHQLRHPLPHPPGGPRPWHPSPQSMACLFPFYWRKVLQLILKTINRISLRWSFNFVAYLFGLWVRIVEHDCKAVLKTLELSTLLEFNLHKPTRFELDLPFLEWHLKMPHFMVQHRRGLKIGDNLLAGLFSRTMKKSPTSPKKTWCWEKASR